MSESHHLEVAIIMQGYLLEILLLKLLYNQPNPSQTLDLMRFQIRTQLEDDLRMGRFAAPVSTDMKQAIDAAFHAMFDRVSGQLENPPPPRHNA